MALQLVLTLISGGRSMHVLLHPHFLRGQHEQEANMRTLDQSCVRGPGWAHRRFVVRWQKAPSSEAHLSVCSPFCNHVAAAAQCVLCVCDRSTTGRRPTTGSTTGCSCSTATVSREAGPSRADVSRAVSSEPRVPRSLCHSTVHGGGGVS